MSTSGYFGWWWEMMEFGWKCRAKVRRDEEGGVNLI